MAEAESDVQITKAGKGAQRAAALMLGLGPQLAAEVFKKLNEKEVRQLALGAKELRRQAPELVTRALQDFVERMEKVGGDSMVGDDVLRAVATQALGDDAARRAFDGIAPKPVADDPLGPIGEADPEALGMVLAREQAQTVALVLSSLPPEKAGQVMEHLNPTTLPQVVRRMAAVESVAPEVLREVRSALTEELQQLVAEGMRRVDGRAAALEILRRTPTAQQTEVLQAIEKDDPELAAALRTKLFTFDDLALLTDRDIQQLSKELDTKQLTSALKGASAEVKDKFLRNMSSRAAELLADDLAAMGPVRLAVVEAAQAEIAKKAVELAEAGKITIVRPTDKML